uniref:TIR domain-containing protein n=2 Tax=Latimeria chalumnae TaxID=7897 RepID=H3A000_LATCH
ASASGIEALFWIFVLMVVAGDSATGYTYRNCYNDYTWHGHISCRNQKVGQLKDVVLDLPSWVKVLNISFTSLQTLPKEGFVNLTGLRHLRLNQNNLSSIYPRAFWGLQNLNCLNLSNNLLSSLNSSAFHGLANLTELILSANRLDHISAQALAPLRNLKILDISFNTFTNFTSLVEAIQDVSSLKVLLVKGNQIRVLESSRGLPKNLYFLNLMGNSITSISVCNSCLSNVIKLLLSNNKISSSEELARLNLSQVQYLDLESNLLNASEVLKWLKNLPASLTNLSLSVTNLKAAEDIRKMCEILRETKIIFLRIYKSGVKEVSQSFNTCMNLQTLDLSNNNIRLPYLFTSGNSSNTLRNLKLSQNKIKRVWLCKYKRDTGARMGQNSSCLQNLEYLTFQYNRLSAIPGHSFSYLVNLKFLSLAVNELNFINKTAFVGLTKLKFLTLSNNAIGEVFDETFKDLHSLSVLKLRNNRISVLYNNTFHCLKNLQILDLGGNPIKRIAEASFRGLGGLQNLYLDRNKLDNLHSGIFKNLTSLKILDLTSNLLSYSKTQLSSPPFLHLKTLRMLKLDHQQPYGLQIMPSNLFEGLGSLRSLYLPGNKLRILNTQPFWPLVNLTHLDLNNICSGEQILPNNTFTSLVNLKILYLTNAGLSRVSKGLLANLKNLQTLVMSENMIRTINKDSLDGLHQLQNLDLRFNPISCTCDNSWFHNWSITSNTQIVLLHHMACPNSDPTTSNFFSFDTSICAIDLGLLAFCSSAPILLGFVMVSMAYSKGRWYFRYGYYLLQAWLRETELQKKGFRHRYDAFISYNSRNEEWVANHLESKLETEGPPYFKLCLHYRDFEAGKAITSNIVDSIYSSRKTICIISRHYLVSEWCSMEIQVALYRLFDEHNDVLILVFLEDIPDHVLSSYYRLRKIVRKKTYLKWPSDQAGQKLFWAKLKDALKSETNAHKRELPSIEA